MERRAPTGARFTKGETGMERQGMQHPDDPTVRAERLKALTHKAHRRAVLTESYEGEITDQDVLDADPAVVSAWVRAGRLSGQGVAPSRRTRR
jgi:hypothetical protein